MIKQLGSPKKGILIRASLTLIAGIWFTACGIKTTEMGSTASRILDKAQGWQRVTFTNEALRERNIESAAGAQWYRSLEIAPSDGEFMLWGTDVGGLYRSLDGGRNWEPANVGYHPRGASAVAVDPHAPERVLAVGMNSTYHSLNGIYLSTDRAASWQEVHSMDRSGNYDYGRGSLVFDASSHDPDAGYTRVVYFSRLSYDEPIWGEARETEGGLMRSEDGGQSWKRIPGSKPLSDAHLSVHPIKGTLLAATPDGVLRSTDRGESWTEVFAGKGTGVARSRVQPDEVWLSLEKSLHRSTDDGRTWTEDIAGKALIQRQDAFFHNIAVAPSNPERLVLGRQAPDYDYDRLYSHDGGSTWKKSKVRRDDNLLPSNARQAAFAFHPEDADTILAPGGDYPTLSKDGGQTYERAGTGVSNILVGHSFNFSTTTEGVVLLATQDYGVLLTTDGGQNWRYSSPAGLSWGGFNYGGYAADPETAVVGDADGWDTGKELLVTRDGMDEWTRMGKIMIGEPYVSYGDPADTKTLFAAPYRTTDGGVTWTEMDGATHVFTHDPSSDALLGILRDKQQEECDFVVRSEDGGESWERLFHAEGKVIDLAYDHIRDRFYLVESDELRIHQNGDYLEDPDLPEDQEGHPPVRSVAVDPNQPEFVYVAANRNTFKTSAGALFSPDAGVTWQNLNRTEPLSQGALDAGREPMWVRVNPVTSEAWFATSCYGVWKWVQPK